MANRRFILRKKEDPKKQLKIDVSQGLYDQIQTFKEEIKQIDEKLFFDLDGLIESVLKNALKTAKKEMEILRKSVDAEKIVTV